jgi:hypothetical protein
VTGRRQADLARAVGISPSYLNLIEHNRRRIAGKLLNAIARELQVDPAVLEEGAESALLEALREAADGQQQGGAELDRLDEFVGRFPGWAELTADLWRRTRALERTVEALSDRLTHDPFLSTSLHEVLSTVTAIRSTATILAETPDIDPEWRGRFHRNMADESERLAESAGALVRYLDEDAGAEVNASTPQEEMDAWLSAQGFHIADMERALAPSPETVVAAAPQLKSAAARSLATGWLLRYRKDVEHMPLGPFREAARATGFDPSALAMRFGVDLGAVFRRMAALPADGPAEAIGLVACDGSGTLTFRKPLDGFGLPRFGAACPLWPLYQALTRPMVPVRQVVEMGGRGGRRFLTYAVCQPSQPAGFDGPTVLEAAMLVLPPALAPVQEGAAATPVGTSCRICPRVTCAARREPSIMAREA